MSNDNPFSESQFKTMKYRPEFPDRFGSIQDSRGFCGPFFDWYNNEHRHTGIGMFTPAQVHFGLAQEAYAQRVAVLEEAFSANPQRFKGKTLVRRATRFEWAERILSLRQTCRIQHKRTFPVLVEAMDSFFHGRQPDLAWIHALSKQGV